MQAKELKCVVVNEIVEAVLFPAGPEVVEAESDEAYRLVACKSPKVSSKVPLDAEPATDHAVSLAVWKRASRTLHSSPARCEGQGDRLAPHLDSASSDGRHAAAWADIAARCC